MVDTPEMGEAYCIVLNIDGTVHVNHFNDSETSQMVWTQGMIITWIAVSAVRLTEFENPSFKDEMFETVPENNNLFQGRNITSYLEKVQEIRQSTI